MQEPLEALERLARLKEQGILTEEEFAAEKRRILESLHSRTVDNRAEPRGEKGRAVITQRSWLLIGGTAGALAVGIALALVVRSDIDSIGSSATPSAGPPSSSTSGAPPADHPDLASLLEFSDPATCAEGESLKDLVAQLASAGGASNTAADAGVRIAGVSRPLTPAVQRLTGGPGSVTIAQIPVGGDWHGLRVTAVRTSAWSDGGVSSLQLRFSDPADQVKSVLTQLGFTVGAVGQIKKIESSEGAMRIAGVEEVAGGSAFTCLRDQKSNSPGTPGSSAQVG